MSDIPKITARDIMTEHVLTAKPDESLQSIVHLMLRNRISGMPVTDVTGAICGVITTTDLFRALGDMMIDRTFGNYDHIFKDKNLTVADVMTKDVVTIKPESAVEEVIKLSVYKNIHLFPVVENGKLLGILGKRDVLNAGFSFID